MIDNSQHEPLVSMSLFAAVQEVFEAANRPRYTKHRHAFAGLVTCGICGCALTAELKKGRYVYYHCTGGRGRCGNGQDSREQARLLKILLSNSAFDRGSLSVSYSKPFDLLVEGNETGNWLSIWESNS